MLASAILVGVAGLLVNNDSYFVTIEDSLRYLSAALFTATLTKVGIGTAS